MSKKFVLGELNETHTFVLDMKAILEKSTKQKIAVTIVEKLIKKSGVPTKKIIFNFEEGQSIGLVLRADGDVIQHFLNAKNIPLFRVMDYDKMADFNAGLEDLALKLKSNQQKFSLKRQTAKIIIPRSKAPSPTIKKRIQFARESLVELTELKAKKTAHFNQKMDEIKTLGLAVTTDA